jgi:GT2 family glycosyltransferase
MPEFHIVIPSASAENLRGCLDSIVSKEPRFPLDHIIVVDDGARKGLGGAFRGITWVRGVKPFVFARNVNAGIRAAGTDVVVMNDDSRLATPGGFSFLAEFAGPRSDIGVCSAAVDGYVGNPVQKPANDGFRTDETTLAFVCVYLPRRVFEVIGPLDERFTAYGGDDVDYCDRIRKAGLLLGIHDVCVVQHDEKLSTFRSKPDAFELYKRGLAIYEEKKRTS